MAEFLRMRTKKRWEARGERLEAGVMGDGETLARAGRRGWLVWRGWMPR